MKNLREQYAEFKDQGVRFMSISLDDSVEKWKKACEEDKSHGSVFGMITVV